MLITLSPGVIWSAPVIHVYKYWFGLEPILSANIYFCCCYTDPMYRGSGLFPPCAQTQGSMRRRRTPQPRAAIAYALNFTSLPKWLVSSYNVALLVGVLRYLPGRYVSDKWRRNNKTNNNSYCLVSRECGVLGGIVHAWLSPLVTTGEKKTAQRQPIATPPCPGQHRRVTSTFISAIRRHGDYSLPHRRFHCQGGRFF